MLPVDKTDLEEFDAYLSTLTSEEIRELANQAARRPRPGDVPGVAYVRTDGGGTLLEPACWRRREPVQLRLF